MIAGGATEVYTDGSGQDGSAGWGWVAVAAGREVQARRGPVVVGADGEGWRGAERATNNTGELTAVLEAIEWAIGKGLREVVIRYDSEYAAHMTRGDWKAKVSKRLRTGVSSRRPHSRGGAANADRSSRPSLLYPPRWRGPPRLPGAPNPLGHYLPYTTPPLPDYHPRAPTSTSPVSDCTVPCRVMVHPEYAYSSALL